METPSRRNQPGSGACRLPGDEAFDQAEFELLHPLDLESPGTPLVSGLCRKCSPPSGTVTTSSARCTPRAMRDELRTWSTRISLLPGRRTRMISSIAASMSGMAHSPNVHTTLSNVASSNLSLLFKLLGWSLRWLVCPFW